MFKTLVVCLLLGMLSASLSFAEDQLIGVDSAAAVTSSSGWNYPPGSTGWNSSPDPNALYGRCLAGSIGSGLISKFFQIYQSPVNETLTDVLAIVVLKCAPFSGGGNPYKVPCPAGSPYAYCVENQNDGQGNDVILGVLKIDTITDPNASYTGCPSGSQLRPKINLVKGARIDPRRIKGIVTLTCSAATQPTPTPPTVVACPSGPSPYSYCLETPNDGFGNAVTIGVVRVTDAGDPYGLYGECNTTLTAYGIQPGFLSKSSLVTAVGRSLDNVRTIDLIACSATAYGVPDHLEIVPCGDPGLGTLGSRYDYCIFGTDAKGNGVNAGVK